MMEWSQVIQASIDYIEEHILEDITVEEIARIVHYSPYHFQKGFSLLCGMTISEYIRNRRLSLAGYELATSKIKVIDAAYKYGYDSSDSFTKAFTRFHGVSPSMARRKCSILKSFAPLRLKIILEGGNKMDYKIEQKDAFKVMGYLKTFNYEEGKEKIPMYWNAYQTSEHKKYVHGEFGINIDESFGNDTFDYMIADTYDENRLGKDCIVKTIPAFTWAIFPCYGEMPKALQDVNYEIFSKWLPALKEYEIAAGYCIEMYEDPKKYPKGIMDEHYYSEIWIPIKKK